jgi:ATP-dependent DNA helicase Rep
MYVGITRAKVTLAVSWTRRRKRAARWWPRSPAASSPRWRWTKHRARGPARKLKALRAEFARRAADASAAAPTGSAA